ncbi:MAG: 30S ribosome-binding factor RbfA [Candidatus Falkowbacteria bacterium]
MSDRLDKINELILHKLAEIINREIGVPNVLVTLVFVKCSEDLNYATVGISVLPASYAGTVLSVLRKKAGFLSQTLRKNSKLGRVPKLNFTFDATEVKASILEKAIAAEEEELKEILKDK